MLELLVENSAREMGQAAAKQVASLLRAAVEERGQASMVVSTGVSELYFFQALVEEKVPWKEIELFHLGEYLGLPETHRASCRRYLKERFLAFVPIKTVHFVDGEGDVKETLQTLTELLADKTIDVGVVGFGGNAHVAFNNPPADFETEEPYKLVSLDQRFRIQQVGEGWFSSIEDVPQQALTMTVRQILKCRALVSVVSLEIKAQAVKRSLTERPTPEIPASILKTHPEWYLYLEPYSAAELFPL